MQGEKGGIRDVVFFNGGPVRNVGMVQAMERELGKKMHVPTMPQIVVETRAALLASEK